MFLLIANVLGLNRCHGNTAASIGRVMYTEAKLRGVISGQPDSCCAHNEACFHASLSPGWDACEGWVRLYHQLLEREASLQVIINIAPFIAHWFHLEVYLALRRAGFRELATRVLVQKPSLIRLKRGIALEEAGHNVVSLRKPHVRIAFKRLARTMSAAILFLLDLLQYVFFFRRSHAPTNPVQTPGTRAHQYL